MKKSKQAKTPEREDEVDRISNLPDSILHLILSRLQGTEEVIRTSILSRTWRYLWTSVPSIDIDYARGLNPSQEFDSNGFREFVTWVLLNKPLQLDSFRLSCSNYYYVSTIRQWIHAAVMSKIKLLDLMFRPPEWSRDIELPQCLMTCGSLEVLRLCLLGNSLSLPKFTGFSALRVLELREINMLDDKYNVVKYFLESCPLLEELSLIDCHAYSLGISSSKLKNLRIQKKKFCAFDSLEFCCPKLEFFMLRGDVARQYIFKSLDSLKEAVIHPKYLYEVKAQLPPVDFFPRIPHVEYLSTSIFCISQFFDPERDAPIYLPKLKTLEIIVNGIIKDTLIPFLKCVPNLESLHLIIEKHLYGWHKLDLDEAATIYILARHLRKIEFLKFDGKKTKVDLACAFLEHGNELEEMVFNWGDEAMFCKRSMRIMNKVSKSHKVSSTVKLKVVFGPTKVN